MVYYTDLNISTNQIAGAIALEVAHDLCVNNFTFDGFPSIHVTESQDGGFLVHMRCGKINEHEASFSITKKEAVAAAKKFQKEERIAGHLFNIVQKALQELETRASFSQ